MWSMLGRAGNLRLASANCSARQDLQEQTLSKIHINERGFARYTLCDRNLESRLREKLLRFFWSLHFIRSELTVHKSGNGPNEILSLFLRKY